MRLKFGLLAGVFALALTVGVAPTASGQGQGHENQEKGEWICHRTGNGYKLMWVSETAISTHEGHGDVATGFDRNDATPFGVCESLPLP